MSLFISVNIFVYRHTAVQILGLVYPHRWWSPDPHASSRPLHIRSFLFFLYLLITLAGGRSGLLMANPCSGKSETSALASQGTALVDPLAHLNKEIVDELELMDRPLDDTAGVIRLALSVNREFRMKLDRRRVPVCLKPRPVDRRRRIAVCLKPRPSDRSRVAVCLKPRTPPNASN